jgi:protein O-mannosyl-transferase
MSKKKRTRRENNQSPRSEHESVSDRSGVMRNLTIGAIMAISFLVFFNSLRNGYAYDDRTQILQNHVLRDFSNLPTALTKELWFWRVLQDQDPSMQAGPTTPYYRPMFTVFLMVCYHLFPATVEGTAIEQNASWWHLMSILVHLLAVYLTFLVLEKVTGDMRVTAVATLLFAVHPLRSESVAWISGISDPFLAVFLLSSFYFYLQYRERHKLKHLVTSLFLFLGAAFAKEPAVALPIFVCAYELWLANRDKPFRERIKPAVTFGAMFFIVSLSYFAMRYYALGFVFNDLKYTNYPFVHVLMTIPLVIWKYLGLLFWPFNLSLFHGTPLVTSPLQLRFILPVLGLAALAVALWPLRKSTVARFGLAWFFVHLLPVLNLSAFGEDFLVQERYVYTSSIGFSLLIAMGLVKLPLDRWFSFGNRRIAQAAVVVLLVIVLGGKTIAQNPVWNSDDELWAHGVEAAPDKSMAYFILGHHYLKRQRMQQAVDTFEQFLKIQPKNLVVISNLASAHLVVYETQILSRMAPDRAHVDRAIALCELGLNVDARNAPLWDTLGRAYTYDTELKNYARARSCFNQALRYEPNLMLANLHLGFTYLKEGDFDTAIRYLDTARAQQPDFPDIYKFMGYAYAGKKNYQEAIDKVGLYLTLQPEALDAAKERKNIEEMRAKLKAAADES